MLINLIIKYIFKNVIEQPYYLSQKSHFIYFNEDEFNCNLKSWEDDFKSIIEKIIFVNAPTRSGRQYSQYGYYILFPNSMKDDGSFNSNEILPIPKTHENIIQIIQIPKNSKKQLLDELSLFGISRERLFPDDLNAACQAIKHKYFSKQ